MKSPVMYALLAGQNHAVVGDELMAGVVSSHPPVEFLDFHTGESEGCSDISTWCDSWKEQGVCDWTDMKRDCKLTCGHCGGETTTTTAASTGDCTVQDSASNCPELAGFCGHATVSKACACTCGGGTSGGSPTPTPPPPTPPTPTPPTPTPPTPTPTPSGGVAEGEDKIFLDEHNKFRCMHGARPLEWSDDLAQRAKVWGNSCCRNGLEHDMSIFRQTPKQGENLAGGQTSVANSVEDWYNEQDNCDWSTGCKRAKKSIVGHFTAMIWDSSTQIGCAHVQNGWTGFGRTGSLYVCRYANSAPNSGDMATFKSNVFPRVKQASQCTGSDSTGPPTPTPTPPTPAPTRRRRAPTRRRRAPIRRRRAPTTLAPTPAPTPTPSECEDKNARSCPGWASKGYCAPGHQFASYMETNCCASCNAGGNTPTPPTPTPAPTPTPTPNPPAGSLSDEDAQFLSEHNKYRCMHGAAPLTWSEDVANQAKSWSNTCCGGGLKHSESYKMTPSQGENLAMGYRSVASAVAGWYNEISDCGPFPGCTDGKSGVVGHLTAMIWKSSTVLGCGWAHSNNVFVCRYANSPPNYRNQYKANVFGPVKTASQCSSLLAEDEFVSVNPPEAGADMEADFEPQAPEMDSRMVEPHSRQATKFAGKLMAEVSPDGTVDMQ